MIRKSSILGALVITSLFACGGGSDDDGGGPVSLSDEGAAGSTGTASDAGHAGAAGSKAAGGTSGIVGSGTGGAAGAPQGGPGCPAIKVDFAKTPVTVILLVDQSGSMTEKLGNNVTRWDAVRTALLDAKAGFVHTLQDEVRFGLALYSSKNGSQGGATCPMLVQVPPAMSNYDAIAKVYMPAAPLDDTPSGESLSAVAAALAKDTAPGGKHIVFATDGDPDTCQDPDSSTSGAAAAAKALSVKAASDAFAMGIQTHVIGVGGAASKAHLQDVANAGAGAPAGSKTPWYEVLDTAQLGDALKKVIYGARSCVFTLDGAVAPGSESQGSVLLDGKALTYGAADGWKLNGASQVELVGAACTALQQGEPTVSIQFPCGGFNVK